MLELKDDIPEAERDKSLGISVVWLIPLIAVIVGGWLAYRTISEKGPEIIIAFNEAEGLEPGQTRIKYKDVNIGKVSAVSLSPDLSTVYVTARLNKSMSGHLNENSKFWIVRPRISSSGISGLSTLISGIHIAMDTGQGEQSLDEFEGLDTAPDIDFSAEGSKFSLTADSLGSLDRGSPIYYRQIQVGEVTRYELLAESDNVGISVFIRSPYDQLIKNNTRFWNASGVSVEIGATGITADMESLTALVSGGIAFETPLDLDTLEEQEVPTQFTLHSSYRVATETPYDNTELFVMYFDGSIRGLNKGSAVEFRGIEVGKVLDIDVRLDHETLEVKTPVLVELHPETIIPTDEDRSTMEVVDAWFARGLRAQLSTSNLLTGQLFIDLAFHENVPDFETEIDEKVTVFPTVPAAFDRLAQSATDLFEEISQLPLKEIADDLQATIRSLNGALDPNQAGNVANNLNSTLKNVDRLSASLNKSIPNLANQIDRSLRKLNATLDETGNIVSEDSQLIYEFRDLLRSMSDAAKSVDSLTKFLERNPDSLIYGKPGSR